MAFVQKTSFSEIIKLLMLKNNFVSTHLMIEIKLIDSFFANVFNNLKSRF